MKRRDEFYIGKTLLGALLAFVSGAAVTTILIHWAKKRKLHSTYALPGLVNPEFATDKLTDTQKYRDYALVIGEAGGNGCNRQRRSPVLLLCHDEWPDGSRNSRPAPRKGALFRHPEH